MKLKFISILLLLSVNCYSQNINSQINGDWLRVEYEDNQAYKEFHITDSLMWVFHEALGLTEPIIYEIDPITNKLYYYNNYTGEKSPELAIIQLENDTLEFHTLVEEMSGKIFRFIRNNSNEPKLGDLVNQRITEKDFWPYFLQRKPK
ncbi:hypothetical protein [Robertkochia aurantiaca]|uniref:hypothetical protein n=1 Tax=Robertkochia aurantiaca TaxID=2873700 RepID=UPI001CC9A665|nr:hypothetical protein [Robertkochia sp. 3YJGBD-33]